MKEIILTVLASGAVFSFIQFLVQLYFSRKDKTKEIEKKVDALAEKIAETQAINARTAILRFSDELKVNEITHSAEYFHQILDDIDLYADYCKAHQDFKNSYTEIATENIKETYKILTKEGKL